VKKIRADNEFRGMLEPIQDNLDVNIELANVGNHVPQAERNNRFLGERFRACYHNLPFKAIPWTMIKYMCLNQMHNTNGFPAKIGISNYVSPFTIMTGRATDYSKACQVVFGASVQGYNVTRNDQTQRTLNGIYLLPSANKQGGHDVMNLVSDKVVNTPKVKEIPITDLMIKAVEKMTEKDGIKTLKITNRNDEVIVTAATIAGVELDEDALPNDNDEDDDDYV
jgi:hypothetical protein